MTIDHLLALVHYDVDRHAHITVDTARCTLCPHRDCLTTCPAQCYVLSSEGQMEFSYEACLECGTCRIVCDRDAIVWEYPRGGFGMGFRLA
jgi:ferredoxin like protein